MWLYIGFCIALFYAVKSKSNTPDHEPEEVFVDVIKNISRVNNVLQELISNYETLQKLYKSEEDIDSSKYSDSDMGEMFQNIKKEPRSQTSKATMKEKFAATEMYWSDHEVETETDLGNSNQSKKDNMKKTNVSDKDKNIRSKPRTSTTTLKPEESLYSESRDSYENVEDVLKQKIKMSPQNAKENNIKAISKSNQAKTASDDSYVIPALETFLKPFIGTKPKSTKTRSRKINISKEKSQKTGLNIPYSSVSQRNSSVSQRSKVIYTKKVKESVSAEADLSIYLRTHKEKKKSEAFPTDKPFYDLSKDKPIQLEANSEIFMENVKNPVTNRDKKYRDNVANKNERGHNEKLTKTNSRLHHKKADIDKETFNATQLKLQRTENVRVAKANVTYHKTKKYPNQLGDDTQIINNDHKKASNDHKKTSIDHETNQNHRAEDNDKKAKRTDNDKKKTQDDNKRVDIGYKKSPSDHEKANKRNEKANKRHENADIEAETNYKDHKMEKKKLYKEIKTSDESVSMDKNDTHVLREAYGEACMKVVVRKCFKACKKSSKSVCSQTKCKSALKSKFKEHAKSSCVEKFTAVRKPNENHEPTNLQKDIDLFADMRRSLKENATNLNLGGFDACLPTLSVQTEPILNPSTNETKTPRRRVKEKTEEKANFNILRDRFEKACKKISYNKCHDACKCSWNKTCSTLDCSKRLKKLYKKACKKSCKTAYGLDKRSSSSSDSDDDDDDDSSSGS